MTDKHASAEPTVEKKLETLTVGQASNVDSDSSTIGESGAAAVAQVAALHAFKGFRLTAEPAKGVAVVSVVNRTWLAVTIGSLVDSILRDGTIADMPCSHILAATFPYPAGSREAEPVKAYAGQYVKANKLRLAPTDCSRINPWLPEGGHIVVNNLKPGECVIVQVDYKDTMRDDVLVTFAYLKAAAMKIGALIVIVVLCAKKQDVAWLGPHCDVFVEVGKCEPGPGAQAAIALVNESLAGWHSQGIGRVMAEAKLASNGDWTHRREPFIAERAIMRLAWYLYAEGVTIEKIAAIIGINKSNVSRGFDALLIPPKNTVGLVPPKGWHKRWAVRHPEVEQLWPVSKPETGTGTGVVGDVFATSPTPKGGNTAHVANGTPATSHARPVPPNGKP
jgi:hypothetical protein